MATMAISCADSFDSTSKDFHSEFSNCQFSSTCVYCLLFYLQSESVRCRNRWFVYIVVCLDSFITKAENYNDKCIQCVMNENEHFVQEFILFSDSVQLGYLEVNRFIEIICFDLILIRRYKIIYLHSTYNTYYIGACILCGVFVICCFFYLLYTCNILYAFIRSYKKVFCMCYGIRTANR